MKIAAQNGSWRETRLRQSPSDLRGGHGNTSTPVPRYSGKSNWEQYREVFEAIVCSNGWDDVTAALQLLSHLDGDALNVALLVPESRRVKPGFLIESLSEHYNAPGQLAEYKRQFQRAFQHPGDDPSIFADSARPFHRWTGGACTPQTFGQFGDQILPFPT